MRWSCQQRDGLAQQQRGQMHARPIGIVGTRNARDQIALVIDERAVNGDRCCRLDFLATARQLLGSVLPLIKRQDRLAIALVEVVGFANGLRPVPWPSLAFSTQLPLPLFRL